MLMLCGVSRVLKSAIGNSNLGEVFLAIFGKSVLEQLFASVKILFENILKIQNRILF